MTEKKKYDSTVARIAGNLLSGVWTNTEWEDLEPEDIALKTVAAVAVRLAREIVAEVKRTEPEQHD